MLEIQIARLKEARAAERQADAKWKAELLAALEDLIAELMPEVQKPEISVASPSKDKKHS